jgi:hypothetical protein
MFLLKSQFLRICVNIPIAFAAETHRAEEHCLEEQLNMVKLRIFGVGTRKPKYFEDMGETFSATKYIY